MSVMAVAFVLVVTLVLGILPPFPLGAQPPAKVARVGYLILPPLAATPSAEREAFMQGLQERGYSVGQNIVIEYRSAAWNREVLADLADELVKLKVDVIVAPGAQAALVAKNATSTIPIVTTAVADPIASGFAASLARPGGNVTGLTMVSTELAGKRLELLKEALPRAVRIAVLWNPANPATGPELSELRAAARVLGVTLQSLEVRGADDFLAAFATMAKQPPAALITILDPLTASYRNIIADYAIKNRLPAMLGQREFAEAGGLMAYGPHLPDLFRRAAYHVDRILRGTRPADLPFEQPTKFELIINLKTAKLLGLTLPQSLLLRADEVIQ